RARASDTADFASSTISTGTTGWTLSIARRFSVLPAIGRSRFKRLKMRWNSPPACTCRGKFAPSSHGTFAGCHLCNRFLIIRTGAFMAKEIERKFLVKDDGWRTETTRSTDLVQAYIAA